MNTRICASCKCEFPATIEYFRKDKNKKYGIGYYCISCSREKDKLKKRDMEKIKQNSKKYREKNREKILEQHTKYREENRQYMRDINKDLYYRKREEILAKQKLRREKNKEEVRKKAKQHYYENREEILMKNKLKRQTDEYKEKHKLRERKRRELIDSLPNDFTEDQWEECEKYFEYQCAYCGNDKVKLERDHVIPIVKNGPFSKNNILPSCRSCNMSKKDSDFKEWYSKYKYYSKEREIKIMNYLSGNS